MNTLTYSGEKMIVQGQEKIRQFLEESDSWKRLLDFLLEENNYLKIRLTHLDNLHFIEKVPGKKENLQFDIQKTYQIISLNRSAVISYEKWLTRQFLKNKDDLENIFKRHVEIRKQIEKVEMNFAIQKVAFNDQLTKNL